MDRLFKAKVTNGVYWIAVPEADLYILCGCPEDSVKHLMKKGLIFSKEKQGWTFESGPNAILLSDLLIQNGWFSNLAEFPVLQMLYRQGMIVPDHPSNTGVKPLIIGGEDQVKSQMEYIYRGNYGLVSEQEIIEAGIKPEKAHDMMRMKLKFAFGKIQPTEELLNSKIIREDPVEIRNDVFIRRLRLNIFEFTYKDESVLVDLNLSPNEVYEAPYQLGFQNLRREYFAVVHAGEGDGWDFNRPCMSSVLMFQGKIYLIDAGPNLLHNLKALGISVNEIEGVFHTHAHDDHFSGLPILMRSDHRVKYFASPLVRASVMKKLSVLLSMEEENFSKYFDMIDLEIDSWNDISGLEVKPIFSPHPLETTVFLFRALTGSGYRSYAHFADIARLDVLRNMITDDPSAPGISKEYFDRVRKDLLVTTDLKKVDIGGGMIHGSALDFKSDLSKKIVLSHTSSDLTGEEKEIGSGAPFGMVETLICAYQDYLMVNAFKFIESYFPMVPREKLNVLLNNPLVSFNPESILLKKGEVNHDIYLILTGDVEQIRSESNMYHTLSAGAFVGTNSGLTGQPSKETYRAVTFVNALQLPASLSLEFIKRNGLYDEVADLRDKQTFLQNSWLFGDKISFPKQLDMARAMTLHQYSAGQIISQNDREGIFTIKDGKLQTFFDHYVFEILKPGDFFGEGKFLFGTQDLFQIRAIEPSEIYQIPHQVLDSIPIVHWKLYETYEKRMKMILNPEMSSIPVFQWRDSYSTNVRALDDYHQKLFETAHRLYETISSGQKTSAFEDALEFLLRYVDDHFAEEEELLQSHGYPEFKSHQKKHESLRHMVGMFEQRHKKGERNIELPFIHFLKVWIVDHILTVDRKYGPFLNEKGVK
jgi:hemerythrin